MKIAIQGIQGSFHHIVAEKFFGENIELAECMSFTEIPVLLKNDQVESAVMAIENSIAGAILPNYALIDEYELSIEGEVYVNIHHHLMALDGQELSDIREVWSHPMALLQCRKFFREHPGIKLIEEKDTAEVARRIQQENIKGVAAVASKRAADLFNLNIISNDIQTIKNNSTRFFVLKKSKNAPYHPSKVENIKDKSSIKFVTQHNKGSLAEILDIESQQIEFGRGILLLGKTERGEVISSAGQAHYQSGHWQPGPEPSVRSDRSFEKCRCS